MGFALRPRLTLLTLYCKWAGAELEQAHALDGVVRGHVERGELLLYGPPLRVNYRQVHTILKLCECTARRWVEQNKFAGGTNVRVHRCMLERHPAYLLPA